MSSRDAGEQAPAVLFWGGFFRAAVPGLRSSQERVQCGDRGAWSLLRLRNPGLIMGLSQAEIPLRHPAPSSVSRPPRPYRLIAVLITGGLLGLLGLLFWQLAGA